MPYKDPHARRMYQRRYHADRRREARKQGQPPTSVDVADPVAALAEWASMQLVVPPGHPAAGQPMKLPEYAENFLRMSWGSHESALSVARKNGKSAIVAVLVLGYLCGPLRVAGWRGSVTSISKEKAGELRGQVAAIAEASGLDVRVRRSPYPGRITSSSGELETLSADRSAGHASSFDLCIIDETGLMPERSRDLLAGLRSSVSAKAGRVMHISVRGDSPLFREVLENPANAVQVHAAPADCELDDIDAWHAANPGLGTIKQLAYMQAEVERIKGAPGDSPSFRAFDLNQELSPTTEMICSPDDLRACFTDEPPAREGPAYLGFDFGESTSGTAAVAIWPRTGRMESFLAFGDHPPIAVRARRDSAPYPQMIERGELKLFPGRVVQVAEFLAFVARELDGVTVAKAAGDSYKDAEARDALDRARIDWFCEFRRVGAGKTGGSDIRAFQRLVHQRKLSMRDNLSLATAIAKSRLRRDGNGNPGLDRASDRSRIDVLVAAVISSGLAEPEFDVADREQLPLFVFPER